MRQCSRQTRSPSAPLEPSSDRHLPSVAARIYALVPTTAGIRTGTPSAAAGHVTSKDNLAISVEEPQKYICWAGCTKEMIRAALGVPVHMPAVVGTRA